MSLLRAAVVALTVVLSASLVSACDPYPTAYREGTAEINISVSDDGSAVTKVFLDATDHSEAELLADGNAVKAIFNSAVPSYRVFIDSNGGGSPFVVVTSDGVFVPGDDPTIVFDTSDAVSYLLSHGNTSVDISLSLPMVSSAPRWVPDDQGATAHSGYWHSVADAPSAPRGTVTLAPRTSVSEVALAASPPVAMAVLLTLALWSFFRRKRTRAIVFAAGALVAFIANSFTRAYLVVAALAVSGGPLWPSHVLVPAVVIESLICLPLSMTIVGLAAAGVPRPVVRFAPPPGWPRAPEHWLPSFPWLPDPTWPQPPENWIFLVEIPRNAAGPRPRPSTAKARTWVTIYASHLARERQGPTGI
jgi:hypothetical protein